MVPIAWENRSKHTTPLNFTIRQCPFGVDNAAIAVGTG
ncbi:Uncharacterised protein [Vibrio cholerae]|uniref:Uncharacterized protein n=1 Tax=Vibrio cholerae TaxID=666 RepID=A0A655WVA9_VIBCL|nr:Uncharacterised protein [Vibrio cholerae]